VGLECKRTHGRAIYVSTSARMREQQAFLQRCDLYGLRTYYAVLFGDGTLELVVDSPEMPSLSRVPIRHGLGPGVTKIEMTTGAVVSVFFEGGDAQKPFAALFAGGRITLLVVDGDRFEWGGDSAVADAALTETRLTAIETFLKMPGPIVGPAPLAPTPISSATLFSKPGP